MGGTSRGLIQRLKDEARSRTASPAKSQGFEFAEGQVQADSQLLLLRKKSLEARVKELEKTAVTVGCAVTRNWRGNMIWRAGGVSPLIPLYR